MRIKTSELTGVALDWAVAKCENRADMAYFGSHWHLNKSLRYSSTWNAGGPIIEREKIASCLYHHYIDADGEEYGNHWYAEIPESYCTTGDTLLAAAMRCYVASKMGDEVDVPDTLCL